MRQRHDTDRFSGQSKSSEQEPLTQDLERSRLQRFAGSRLGRATAIALMLASTGYSISETLNIREMATKLKLNSPIVVYLRNYKWVIKE